MLLLRRFVNTAPMCVFTKLYKNEFCWTVFKKFVLIKIILNIFRQKYKKIGIKVDPVPGRLTQLNVEMIFIILIIMLKNHNWVRFQV